MVVKKGVRYLSARDIIKFQCQKNNKQVLQAWGRLNPEFKQGLAETLICLRSPGAARWTSRSCRRAGRWSS